MTIDRVVRVKRAVTMRLVVPIERLVRVERDVTVERIVSVDRNVPIKRGVAIEHRVPVERTEAPYADSSVITAARIAPLATRTRSSPRGPVVRRVSIEPPCEDLS